MANRRTSAPAAWMAVLATAIALVGCGSNDSNSDDETSGGASVTFAVGTDVVSWNLYTAPGSGDQFRDAVTLINVYQRLYTLDPDAELQPELAAAMPERVDSRTYRIPLKEGVKFSDGSELTAEDVVYSYQTALDPATKTTLTQILVIEGAKVVDPHTVEVTFKEPTATYAQILTIVGIVPEGFTDWEQPIGSGPYVMTSYTPGEGAELAYNENYQGPKPQVTRASAKIITDPGTRMQALKTGEVDLAYGLSPDDTESAPNVAYAPRSLLSPFIRINFAPAPLDDVRVRQAMNYAVNKEEIVSSLFGEAASVSRCQLAEPSVLGGNPDLEPYPYDPDKARQLLEEAGAVGTKLALETPTGYFAEDRNVSQIVAEQLNAAGFDIELKTLPNTLWLEHVVTEGKKGPEDLRITPIGSVTGDMFRQWSLVATSDSIAGTYENPKFDKLYREALAAQDEATLTAKTAELNKMLCDDATFLFLYDSREIIGLSERAEYSPPFGYGYWIDLTRVKLR